MFGIVDETGCLTIPVRGDLDASTAPAFIADVRRSLGDTPRRQLFVDMSEAGFVDSSGIGALVEVRNMAHAVGATVRLHNVNQRLTRLLRIVGLERTFLDLDVAEAAPERDATPPRRDSEIPPVTT